MRSREWYQRGRGCARAVSLPPPRRYHWTLRRAEDDSLPQDAVMDPSPDSPAEPLVSVVMPCLNEARAVGICVEKARRALADRKSTRLNSSHVSISYAVFCLKKKN